MSSRHIPGKPHRVANFVLYHFDSPPEKSLYLKDRYKLDSDILRAKIISKDKHIEPDYKCTLEEESLPPSYRKTVQELLNKKPKEYGLPTKPPKQEYEF
ncbi:hypothetical protein B4U79_14546 [Dinothrombium tinctorium]|uniref:Uncharacterized protein n=1 Tax=Dinothrombium tinctorium TaxID=1965070 RepID=A0A3S3NVZ0_9ACAR|nr:hypothetical protein B4U79_09811 [Dinothrombium tinctorium]RWS10211.1 hypothetical protein B4U79_15460 [Dinothrombium tinctorium]RWS10558.1 hypothetical protein B4U79_14546 [Dinothrombium tinctorium]